MPEPVFTQIYEDVLWTYDPTLTEFSQEILGDTDKWFASHIRGKGPGSGCVSPPGMTVIQAYDRSRDKGLQVGSTCGAEVIVATGFTAPLILSFAAFHSLNLRLLEEKKPLLKSLGEAIEVESMLFEDRMMPSDTVPAEFWDTLDSWLVFYNSNKPVIGVVIDQNHNTAYVHLDLGSNRFLINTFFAAISADRDAYVKWLTSPSTKLIDRKLFIRPVNDTEIAVDLHPASIIRLTPQTPPPMLSTGPCPANTCYTACNIDTGNANSVNPNSGIADITLRTIIVKPYCQANPSGNPCP